jgi:hypothetical protein
MSALDHSRPSQPSCLPFEVRFDLKAIEALLCGEMTRWAMCRLMHCGKKPAA